MTAEALDAVAVGRRIAERRAELECTQTDLGSVVITKDGEWTPQPVVSGWETGWKPPTDEQLTQIAEGLDVSVEWLRTGVQP